MGILFDTIRMEREHFCGVVYAVPSVVVDRIEVHVSYEVGSLLCCRTRHGVLGKLCHLGCIVKLDNNIPLSQSASTVVPFGVLPLVCPMVDAVRPLVIIFKQLHKLGITFFHPSPFGVISIPNFYCSQPLVFYWQRIV